MGFRFMLHSRFYIGIRERYQFLYKSPHVRSIAAFPSACEWFRNAWVLRTKSWGSELSFDTEYDTVSLSPCLSSCLRKMAIFRGCYNVVGQEANPCNKTSSGSCIFSGK